MLSNVYHKNSDSQGILRGVERMDCKVNEGSRSVALVEVSGEWPVRDFNHDDVEC